MAYVDRDYNTKKEFKEAFAKGVEMYPYINGGFHDCPQNGTICIEGPHYPRPHKWYASVVVENGKITKIKG